MMIAAGLAAALDAAYFAQQALGLEPDPWQQAVLRSTSNRLLLLCCRQSGKSTISAALATHTALYQPKSLVLVVSPSQRQSGELFRKITDQLEQVIEPGNYEEDTRTMLSLNNGSRIVSLPGTEKTIRGFSAPALVVIDEAARVDDALMAGVRPMVATNGGKIAMLSTPWGKRGAFFDAWTDGGSTWERTKITALDCERIPADFIEESRREFPPLQFAAEFMCEFTETIDNVFSFDDIDAAVSDNITPLFERATA